MVMLHVVCCLLVVCLLVVCWLVVCWLFVGCLLIICDRGVVLVFQYCSEEFVSRISVVCIFCLSLSHTFSLFLVFQ